MTTLPKEVGPGGFDRTIVANGVASGYFFKAATPEFTSQTPGTPAGSFTVLYSRGAASADVRVTFRGTDGARSLTSADLGRLGMEALVDGLLGAARCDGASAS